SGYEPDELPGCSIPRPNGSNVTIARQHVNKPQYFTSYCEKLLPERLLPESDAYSKDRASIKQALL
ncbi:MAG: hypothetical protein RPR97_19585, partial [Colwellia sp.]